MTNWALALLLDTRAVPFASHIALAAVIYIGVDVHTLVSACDLSLRADNVTATVEAGISLGASFSTAPAMVRVGFCVDTLSSAVGLIGSTDKLALTRNTLLATEANIAANPAVLWVCLDVFAHAIAFGLALCA